MEHKISGGTIARSLILILAVVNQMLTMSGHSLIPISDELINALVSNLWTISAALLAWWKNNSFTKSALVGDHAMKQHCAMQKQAGIEDDDCVEDKETSV